MMAARFCAVVGRNARLAQYLAAPRFASFQPTFQHLLQNSALYKLDKAIFGRHVEGIVIENEADRIVVDVGLKLPGVLRRDELGLTTRYLNHTNCHF